MHMLTSFANAYITEKDNLEYIGAFSVHSCWILHRACTALHCTAPENV